MPFNDFNFSGYTVDRALLKSSYPVIDAILERRVSMMSRNVLNACLSVNLNPFLVPLGPVKLSIADWVVYNKSQRQQSEFYNFVRIALKVQGKSVDEKLRNAYCWACEDNHSHIMNFLEAIFPKQLDIPSISDVHTMSCYPESIDSSINHYQLFRLPRPDKEPKAEASIESIRNSLI